MSRHLTAYLPFSPAITPLQAATYLLFICLSSISFLVFLNASISFVLTDLLSLHDGIGAMVGTLGFADELVALVACPVWGIVSDRLGVRWVACWGYIIVAVALVGVVSVGNGEQEQQQEQGWEGWGSGVGLRLLLVRMGFSVGGAAVTTMVTAGLPTMVGGGKAVRGRKGKGKGTEDGTGRALRSSIANSLESQITITPERYSTRAEERSSEIENENGAAVEPAEETVSSPPKLAGLVGVFTGLGAILGLLVFLPLPAEFSRIKNVTQGQAVQDAFYVVGGVALCVAIACFFGLRNLPGEEGKGWRVLLGIPKLSDEYRPLPNGATGHVGGRTEATPVTPFFPYWRLLFDSTVLGFKDAQIGLGYLGGFVARASSVGISLFIPLYINAYFIRNGFCQGSPTDPSSPELKKECRAAYLLSSELTGISQLIALLCAPGFGYLSDRYRRFNLPILAAAVFGIVGYSAFARLTSPEVKNINGRGGSPAVFLIVAFIGISQIGAIVCSLGLLGRGVLGAEGGYNLSSQLKNDTATTVVLNDAPETSPLLNGSLEDEVESRTHLKGSIAGVYSLSGGAAILLLTKLGGYLFDSLSPGAPFYMMAIFNGILLVVGIGSGAYREIRTRQLRS